MFRHQLYKDEPRTSTPRLLRPPPPPPVESDEWRAALRRAAEQLRAAGVRRIYLIHGTFAGTDALGLLRELGRFFPTLQAGLARIAKSLVDVAMNENGNFTVAYGARLQAAFRAIGDGETQVVVFPWSGENHHLGRAEAAVHLIDELASAELPDDARILVWGHSHAGNAMALASQLLAGDHDTCEAFFAAARCHYRIPWFGKIDLPIWQRVLERLCSRNEPAVRPAIDFVTFGTPIRYGWNPRGYARLLHFINHRPCADRAEHLTTFPQAIDDILTAKHGDYIQQFGIAGTNSAPLPPLRAWFADRRLGALLQPAEFTSWNLLARVRAGVRVPDEGETLLVDYGPMRDGIEEHLAGHAVYTRSAWLPYHAGEVAMRFYGTAPDGATSAD